MKSDVPLDYAIFHLTPTRTRCELLVASGKEKERLATGLIKPFLTHLKAVEDQISNGCCSSSSITLQPPPSTTNTFGDTNANASKKKDPPPPPPHDAPWFTKGTVERFVRFVSTPEVLEFVSSVEDELTQIEEAISLRAMESASPSSWGVMSFALHPSSQLFYMQVTTSIIRQVACAMDARRLVLHKEQGIAFTRAAAAGFDVQHMAHLLAFADCFGATRLRDACVKFMALCKKRQEACNYIEEMESEAMNSERLCLPVSARSDGKKQDDKEDDLCKEAPCRSLSVKDAISLFEVKRVDATEEFKKKHPRQQEPCRVSTGTPRTSLSSSSVFEKPVLRRWSQIAAGNNSDCSHIETEQQSKDLCCSSPEDLCTQYETTMVKILPEPHQSTESFRTGIIKVVVSEASTIAPGMHGGEFSRMSVDSVLPPDSLAKYAAARSALLCSSGPDNDSSFYQEAHAEEEKDFVAFVESEGQKTRTVAKDQELVQPALPSFVLDASNTAVASQAASAEDNSSNQLRTGIQQEVELPDGDQHSSLLKESKFSTSENSPSIAPASDTDDSSLALNTAANQKSVSEFHHEENKGDVKHVVGVVKGETNSPQEPKGRFYEHYRERRDAKLREEPGSKRAEREAKLKAMHEVLEKRKEEMVACNNNNSKMVPEKLHSAASVDTQLHAEKLHNFKPELAIGRKSKVLHKLSSPQKFFPGSSPHVNMNIMSPASAAVPGAPKLSSRAASQRWSATALVNSTTSGEILLSHSSGPCVAELRKENTKPLAVRSSTLHERKLVNKTISGTVLRSSTAPLEANRSQPAAVVSFNVYEDKKSRNSSMRRSLSLVSADLLQEAPPTVSQTPALKISKTTPFYERESYHAPCVLAAATVLSPSGVNDGDDEVPHSGVPNSPPLCEAHSSSLAEEALSSHYASPIASQAVPALEVSLSPQASSSSFGTTTAARSRRKWGCAEKMQPPIIIMSKESPKGIRKLLKFGRKSRNSGCSFPSSTANDWHETASTTTTTASDAEDADLELNNRMSFSNLTKRLERSWKNGGPQLLLHKGGRTPRSFFSLSTFRSRSNESKSRS
ncbi:unnamed protein product [Sphagnum jensenii]|uniref:Uncharacterized protein n=1 Tax=Sphagnum jensenii TaxID=128206 RepID=A0ABP1ANN2_9BRYO